MSRHWSSPAVECCCRLTTARLAARYRAAGVLRQATHITADSDDERCRQLICTGKWIDIGKVKKAEVKTGLTNAEA